jgi:steroid delta-isomerase-like uncharacterized protein
MTREQAVALFAERQELWKRHDATGLAAAHTDDGEVVSPIFGAIQGRAAIEESYRELFTVFEDFTLSSQSLVIDGEEGAQVFTAHATHSHELFGVPGTGRKFEIQGVAFYRFAGSQIAWERRFYDFTGMLVRLGVLRARPGKG